MVENLASIVTKNEVFIGIEYGNIQPTELKTSTKYDVLILDKLYPPKEVIRLAAKSKGLNPKNYYLNGGDSTNKYLQKMGFPIFSKKGNHLGGGDTGKIWKLGTRWGKGKPNYNSLLETEKIVISVERFKYNTGDLVVIMDGHTVTSIARVESEMIPVTSTPELQEQFESLEIEWSEWILTAKATIYNLNPSEQFIYKLDAGIREVQKQEVKEKAIKFWFEKYYKNNFLNSFNKKDLSPSAEINFSGNKSFNGINDSNVKPKLDANIISKNFARLITNLKDNKGQMLGLFGQWGRGKTFLMDLVCKELKIGTPKESNFYYVNFHAWKYQDTEGVWAYLYQQITEQYFTHKKDTYWITSKLKEYWLLSKLNFNRNGFGDAVLFLMLLVFAATIIVIYPELIENVQFWKAFFITSLSTQTLLFLKKTWKLGDKGKRLIKKYTHKPSFNKLLGVQAEIQEELKYVLKSWIPKVEDIKNNKRLLLFVDDLDRCKEERLIQVIDALRVMLEDQDIVKRVIIVTAIDEKILERAIELKYNEFLDKEGDNRKGSLIKEYLDKLFIACIKLPPLYDKEKEVMIDAYADKIGVEIEETKLKTQVTSGMIEYKDLKNIKTEVVESESKSLNGYLGVEKQEEKKIIIEESKKTEESTYIIKSKELILLKGYAKKLEGDITPRQLRIFMYRYLLARDLAKSFNNNIAPSEEWCRYALSKIVENRNKNFIEFENNEIEKESDIKINGVSEELKESTQKLIAIVAPY
ncbi:hypothetical protein WH52_09435 [Tenacibaculum holothuriorum]|uniref:KAP NTPase domain-containing protein n=1 Tax=Tenacibaculum holothuriorum TaxID=1635173 RepID=A0A1Y2PB38_9FLAO|nr:P-loop NTPase fold protein [Tenacibaculum holothuriorum]OSY87652.1 hypothetical protein WH52_09435 [Tenacibaculum holothuriorum]